MPMWTRYLTDPLRGRTALWKVIWIYGFGVSIVYSALALLFPATSFWTGANFAIGLIIGIVQCVMLWQCAYNTRYRGYGAALRVLVVIGALLVPALLFGVFRHPELLRILG